MHLACRMVCDTQIEHTYTTLLCWCDLGSSLIFHVCLSGLAVVGGLLPSYWDVAVPIT
jgi:hypothetical protein